MNGTNRVAWVAAAAAILVLAARGQQQQAPPPQSAIPVVQTPPVPVPSEMQPDLASPVAPDTYVIGPEDLLSVFVYQMPEFSRRLRVGTQGGVSLPFLPHQLQASGLTPPQLAAVVRNELAEAGLARHPQVQVMVTAVESKPIVVAGQVRNPGTLQAARPMSLLEVLSRCGGLTDEAGDTVLITRTDNRAGTAQQTINLAKLLREHDAGDNPVLTGNEWVTVAQAALVYAVGTLKKPGAFPLRTGQPISVVRAVALAGGLGDHPNDKHAVIFRLADGGTREAIPVRLDQILDHKAADMLLRADDILYVPKNGKQALFAAAAADAAQAAVIATGYGLQTVIR